MRIGATLLAIAGALALGAPAQAAPRSPDFHDARYCEILELRGEVPNAVVTVWNTIGLNDCPPAKWEALDAGAIAAERGDAAVILNGPRHFLMDSGRGAHRRHRDVRRHPRCARSRRSRSRPPPSWCRRPYTERTIKRHNTWTWEAGRRVYELLAPDGTNYVMQSYSQIRDPELSIGQLRSLGDRLDPAAGLDLPQPPPEARPDPARQRDRDDRSRTTCRTPTSGCPGIDARSRGPRRRRRPRPRRRSPRRPRGRSRTAGRSPASRSATAPSTCSRSSATIPRSPGRSSSTPRRARRSEPWR